MLAFQGKNLFRFLNETSYNWCRFLILLDVKVRTALSQSVLICFLPTKRIVITKFLIRLTTARMGINFVKFRKESMMHKTEATVLLIKNARKACDSEADILQQPLFYMDLYDLLIDWHK